MRGRPSAPIHAAGIGTLARRLAALARDLVVLAPDVGEALEVGGAHERVAEQPHDLVAHHLLLDRDAVVAAAGVLQILLLAHVARVADQRAAADALDRAVELAGLHARAGIGEDRALERGHEASAPAALAALEGYLGGEPIDALAQTLGLTHSGAVRLVDHLCAAGLAERRRGAGGRARRAVAGGARHPRRPAREAARRADRRPRLGAAALPALRSRGLRPPPRRLPRDGSYARAVSSRLRIVPDHFRSPYFLRSLAIVASVSYSTRRSSSSRVSGSISA